MPVPVLDHALRWCGGRTVRELIVVGGGLAIVAEELLGPGRVDVGNLIVYVAASTVNVRSSPAPRGQRSTRAP